MTSRLFYGGMYRKVAEAQRRALPQRTQRRAGNNRKNKATKIDVGRDDIPPFF
jgi:hypothetical protein